MVQNVKTLGGQRYRETFGRYYEDFVVGDELIHATPRTVTEADAAKVGCPVSKALAAVPEITLDAALA